MAVLEAQRAGGIVVASAVGAFPEIVTDGVDGFLLAGAPAAAVAAEKILGSCVPSIRLNQARIGANAAILFSRWID